MKLLNFLDECKRVDGTTILENGDLVLMDNCGFHHGNFVEPSLRDILQEHVISLLFQLAYSPHLNTCEFSFNQVKSFLKQNSLLTESKTEIVVSKGVSNKNPANSVAEDLDAFFPSPYRHLLEAELENIRKGTVPWSNFSNRKD